MAAAASATSAACTPSASPTTATSIRSPSPCLPLERSSSSLHKSAARTESPLRAIVESVRPEVDGGRFAVKRVVGEEVVVEADVFTDGHDAMVAVLLYKHQSEKAWREVPMQFRHNDHWVASFRCERLGRYAYTVRGWADPF